jgi:starch phosphorylase
LSLGKDTVGAVGEIHPDVCDAFGVTERVAWLELDLSRLLAIEPKVAQWKARVRSAWHGVTARRLDAPRKSLRFGEGVRIDIAVDLNGLTPDDVIVEMMLARQSPYEKLRQPQRLSFEATGERTAQGEHRFALALTPELCGRLEYRIRVYPCHELLTHPFELGMMTWL